MQAAFDVATAGERGTAVAAFDRSGGRTRWLRIDTIPRLDDDNRVTAWLTTLFDVTPEMEAEEELRKAQDELWHLATTTR